MKTTKLVVGILMIVLAVFIMVQSMAVGVSDAMSGGKHVSGTSGFFVALLYIVMGIVYLATRKAQKLGGDIANLVLAILVLIIGLSDVGVYSDLQIWSWLGFIIGAGFFVWHFISNKNSKKSGI